MKQPQDVANEFFAKNPTVDEVHIALGKAHTDKTFAQHFLRGIWGETVHSFKRQGGAAVDEQVMTETAPEPGTGDSIEKETTGEEPIVTEPVPEPAPALETEPAPEATAQPGAEVEPVMMEGEKVNGNKPAQTTQTRKKAK
jgi:hypothetical protein